MKIILIILGFVILAGAGYYFIHVSKLPVEDTGATSALSTPAHDADFVLPADFTKEVTNNNPDLPGISYLILYKGLPAMSITLSPQTYEDYATTFADTYGYVRGEEKLVIDGENAQTYTTTVGNPVIQTVLLIPSRSVRISVSALSYSHTTKADIDSIIKSITFK